MGLEAVVLVAGRRGRGDPRRPSSKEARGAEDRQNLRGWLCYAGGRALEPGRGSEPSQAGQLFQTSVSPHVKWTQKGSKKI